MWVSDGFVDIPSGSTTLCHLPAGYTCISSFITDYYINGQKFRFSITADGVYVYNYDTAFSDGNTVLSFTYPC